MSCHAAAHAEAMDPQRLAVHPHTPTPPGTLVEVQGFEGTYLVMAHFVAYQDGKPRHCYVLQGPDGELCCALNGWHTPLQFLSDRLDQLRRAAQEMDGLKDALRHVAGEQ